MVEGDAGKRDGNASAETINTVEMKESVENFVIVAPTSRYQLHRIRLFY